ncbi:zf-HC2 domain-containing protein [Actinotalea sp. AC32]|nr:zf-HC2 domain-containing protein [Actinotalea sp. AC32]
MNHLGTQVSALADGQLSPGATERALAHVAVCRTCAEELQAAREARRTLAGAGDVLPAPDLTARLLALGALPPADAPRDGERWHSWSVPLPGHGGEVPHGPLRGDVLRRRALVPRPVLAALAGGVGVVATGLVVVGGQPPVVPETDRSYALSVLAEAAGTGPAERRTAGHGADSVGVAVASPDQVPALAPAAPGLELDGDAAHAEVLSWMAEHGWVSPVDLPEGFRVTGLRLDEASGRLELDLEHDGGTVVVLQEPGRLDDGAVDGLPVQHVRGRAVHLVSAEPWYVVWQDGDTVVTVVAEDASDSTHDLVGAHPGAAYDDGVPARLARGWQALAGSLSP